MYTLEELRAILIKHDEKKDRVEALKDGIFEISFTVSLDQKTEEQFETVDNYLVMIGLDKNGKAMNVDIY